MYFLPHHGKPQTSPHPPSPLAGLCEPATSLGTPGAAGGAGGQPPGNLAGRLLRTAAVHRVQAGGAGRLPNRRTLYPASGRLHTKNSCRPGPGSATRPRVRPRLWGMLRENYFPADKMAEAVTADEASILQVGAPKPFQAISPIVAPFSGLLCIASRQAWP